VAFLPRAALRVTANYSAAAEMPRTPREAQPLSPWKRPALDSGEEARAWCLFAVWLFCGLAAMAWFWKFSKG
jgi:hypothetical protein